MELMPVYAPKSVILPTDFNCMGYAVPAAIGAKLACPDRTVQTIVGDGAFMMTCMEILTASSNNLGIVYYVFNDGELAQIAQAQSIPYGRKPGTTIGKLNIEGVALATGAAYLPMNDNGKLPVSSAGPTRSQAPAGPSLSPCVSTTPGRPRSRSARSRPISAASR